MKLIKLATATALVAFSAGSFAAKPTSIVFVGNAETGDEWCVGDAGSESCEKKQIKAAKAACKGQ
jgi:hypothetical protein